MSAFPINPQQDTSDVNNYVRELVRQNAVDLGIVPQNQNNQQVAPQQGPGQGINVNIGGQSYQFANEAELSRALEQTFGGYQSKIEELQGSNQEIPQQQQQPEEGFDKQRYAELMGTDPIEAQNYLDSHRLFNGNIQNPHEVLKDLVIKVDQQDAVLAAYQFRDSHPEFQASPQGAAIMQGILKENNWDMNAQNLEAALAVAQQRNLLPTRQQWIAAQAQAAQNFQAQQGTEGLPQLSQQQAPPQTGIDPSVLEGLTPDQIAQLIQNGQLPMKPPITQPPDQPVQPQQYPQPLPQPVPAGYPQQPNVPVAAQPPVMAPGGNPPHMNPRAPNLPPLPPPSVGTGAAPLPANWMSQADNLSTDQIQQIFDQYES